MPTSRSCSTTTRGGSSICAIRRRRRKPSASRRWSDRHCRVKPGDDRSLLRRKALVDAFPFVVADELLVVLEIHAIVAVGEFARLHVDEHRLDRLGGVHDGVESEHGAIEAELAELLHR